ncbi:MAG: hypothetical protein LBJ18_04230 [Rickettsiales bacterium]|jgi:type IV secretion system protein VirB4|nr:hypothetical protein [Rickettsiales bacterium]
MYDFYDFFAGTEFPITMVILAMAAVFVFIVLMMYVPTIARWIFPQFGYKKYSEYLPFAAIMGGDAIKLTDGTLVRAYRISGVQTSMQDERTRAQFLDLRSSLLNQIRDPHATLRFFTIRDSDSYRAEYEFDQPTLQKIYDKWDSQGMKIFNNNYYLMLSVSGNNAADKLQQYGNYCESILAAYSPKVLSHNSPENMAKLFGRILSPITKPAPAKCDGQMAAVATVDDVEFLDGGLVKYSSGNKTKVAALLSFKVSPDFMEEEFFDEVSTIQCEMISLNAMRVLGAAAVETVVRQQRATINENNEDIMDEQISAAQNAMDENVSGTQVLVNYYPLFALFADSENELNDNIASFKKIAASFGISPVVENFAAKVSWFSQIPGFDVFPRSFKMLSKTAAISIPMSSLPRGVPDSDWGPGPLVVFPTAQGTPYQFQFHISSAPGAVGHTLTIGPTGGGKTTLFSFLISQSLRHPKLKAFFFDRNRGAEIFTLATGGKYLTLSGKSKGDDDMAADFLTRLNPLRMEDTADNRMFLRRWLAMISGQADARSLDEIARAVSVNFDYVDDKNRQLKNLYESCFSSDGAMRGALKKWIDPLQYGTIFNESRDTLDLYSRLTTFDFTDILADDALAPAVISYIIHRINSLTISGGNPSLIMIDETAPMLENKMFRDNFIAGLQEGRKNRQAYMAAFQRANVLDKLGIGDVVRGQAQTVLFFRNPAADYADYEHWKLNPLEMAFIQGKAYPNLKRAVLLSRPVSGESVVLNTELGGLGNLLRLFESGRPSVLLAEELYKQFGTSFVEEYLRKNA